MKKLISVILSLILLFNVSGIPGLSNSIYANSDVIVVFADPGLEAAVRSELNKPINENILKSEVQGITSLSAISKEISSLTGIENLTNLTDLDLGRNKIADISLLKDLTSLKCLYLSNNLITDISPLIQISSLEKLYLNGNSIEDISSISMLTNLNQLDISFNSKITDISSVTSLSKLKYIGLSQTQVTDISVLSNLHLNSMDIASNKLTNIGALATQAELVSLDLSNNKITDIKPLCNLVNLKSLLLSQNPICDYTPLHGIYGNLTYKDFTLIKLTSIEINGTNDITIPEAGIITTKFTAVSKDQNGAEMVGMPISWAVYDNTHNLTEEISIDVNGLLTISSVSEPNSYIVEARSTLDNSVYCTKSVLLNPPKAPELTEFTWVQGNTVGTTQALVVPDGTLKYVVGAAGSQVRPNVGETAEAYTHNLNANNDIPVTEGQHLFVVQLDSNGKIKSWSDIAVNPQNIKKIPIPGSDERLISGRVTLSEKAPAGGVNVLLTVEGTKGASFGFTIIINEGESYKNFDIPTSINDAGQTCELVCTAQSGDAIGFTESSQIDISKGNVSNINLNISLLQPKYINVSGKITLNSGVAPQGGIVLTLESSANINNRFTKECYSNVTIPEGENSVLYTARIISYAGYPCRLSIKDSSSYYYWGTYLDISSSDITDLDAQIMYPNNSKLKEISGTIYLSTGVAPAGGIKIAWNSTSGSCTNSGLITIPAGLNFVNYDILFSSEISAQTVLCFTPLTDYKQYSFIVEENDSVKDINLEKITETPSPAPILSNLALQPGNAVGTTRAHIVSAGTFKYVIGSAGAQARPNVGDSSAAYINTLTADTDIAVTSGQHIFIVQIADDGTIIGWADITVNDTIIKSPPVPAILINDIIWAPGSTAGTTKATSFTQGGPLKYIVGPAGAQVQPNMGDNPTAYTNTLTVNTDISVTVGQHIFIVRIDFLGNIVGWADIAVDSANIKSNNPPPPTGGGIPGGMPLIIGEPQQSKPEPKDGTLIVVPAVDNDTATVELGLDEYKALLDSVKSKDENKNLIITIDDTESSIVKTKLPTTVLSSSTKEATTTIKTSIANIVVPSNMLNKTLAKGGSDTSINIAKVDLSTLPPEVADTIGNAPVIDISLTINGTVKEWSNPNAPVTISIPYTLKKGERGDCITVYYINSTGRLENMQGIYNSKTKTVEFTTTHFSAYFVKENEISFKDLAGFEEYSKYIENMASKGIIEGVGYNMYSPEKVFTRAEFATLLVKMLKLDTSSNKNTFVDVKSTDWFAPYVNAAYKAGLIAGIGNSQFAPNAVITNQDAAIILVKALKYMGVEITSEDLTNLNDSKEISNYALEAVSFAVSKGVISLDNDSNFNAKSTVNRATAAKYIYNVFYYEN